MNMKNIIKLGLIAAVLAGGLSPAMAARRADTASDPWFSSLHLDNTAVPAKQYFEEMQRDGQ
jgi:hypothetical protein